MQYFGKKSVLSATVASTLILFGGLAGCSKSESSTTLVADAKQFQAKGDIKAAVIQLKNAILKNGDDASARLLLGTLYADSADYLPAEKELRKAQSLGSSPDAVLPPLTKALLGLGQFQKVVDATESPSAQRDPVVLAARGDALLLLRKAELAKEAYDRALVIAPDSVAPTLGLARYKLGQQDVAGATAYADAALAKHPDSVEVWLFHSELLHAAGKTDEALAGFDKVLALNPQHRSAHLEKANLEIATRKFDAAKADIDAANKITPNNLTVLYTQTLLDFTKGNFAAAREGQQKVLRAAPEHMPTLLMAGATELQLGALSQGEAYLKKYLESNPQNAYARKLMATVELKQGRSADALTVLAPVLRDSGEDAQLLALAGEASLQAHDFAKATDYFQRASKLAPQTAAVHTGLGRSQLALGQTDNAVAELAIANGLDTKSSQAGILLVLTELRAKRLDKALAAANALAARLPQDATVENLRGGVYLSMADSARARASFERALTLQPTFFPAASNLAQLAMRENKPELAKQGLLAFLDKNKKNAEAMNSLAALAASQGAMAEATKWLEQSQSDNPDAVAPALTLSKHYLRIGEKQKALTLARKYQVAHADSPDLLDVLGQAQLANGDAAAALDAFSKLAGMLPKAALPLYRVATAHMALKNPAAATEDLKKAVALQPDYLDGQLGQIELALQAHQQPAALAIARTIAKQRPREAVGYATEADILWAQQQPGPALQAYEKAFEAQPTSTVLIRIHGLMRRAGRQKEADARLAQWDKAHPNDIQIGMYIAENSLAAKDYPLAIRQFTELLKRYPNSPMALNNLAWAYGQQNDARALPTAEQALKAAPQNPAIMDTLGWLLVEHGDAARGRALLQQAVEQAPAAPELRWHLVQALAKAGDKAGARREGDKMLAEYKNFPQIDEVRALLKQL